jgi:hypothetical protein
VAEAALVATASVVEAAAAAATAAAATALAEAALCTAAAAVAEAALAVAVAKAALGDAAALAEAALGDAAALAEAALCTAAAAAVVEAAVAIAVAEVEAALGGAAAAVTVAEPALCTAADVAEAEAVLGAAAALAEAGRVAADAAELLRGAAALFEDGVIRTALVCKICVPACGGSAVLPMTVQNLSASWISTIGSSSNPSESWRSISTRRSSALSTALSCSPYHSEKELNCPAPVCVGTVLAQRDSNLREAPAFLRGDFAARLCAPRPRLLLL